MSKEKCKELVKSPRHLAKPLLPPPPPPRRPTWSSHTRREIEKFWRKKRLVEEEHLLAAIKSAARLRASHLSEVDYKLFLESLEENESIDAENKEWNNNPEIRVGIKDWWTKSKYAYLNQPEVGSTMRPSRRSNYTPNTIFFCNYKLLPTPAEATYLGVY